MMSYILGGALLFGASRPGREELHPQEGRSARTTASTWSRRDRIAAIAIGLVGGFIVGLTSVGSGTFFGLTMLFVFPLRAHKVVGTDILHAAALLYVAGFGHIIAGNVDMHAVGWLLIGSIPGVLIGSHYSVRLPEATLRFALANVLAVSGLKLVNVPNVYLDRRARDLRDQRRRPARPRAAALELSASARGEPGESSGLNSRGLAPPGLDPARRRAAGRDGRRVRGHAGPEDRAQPDPRAADRQGLLAGLRLRLAGRDDPVPAAEARPRAASRSSTATGTSCARSCSGCRLRRGTVTYTWNGRDDQGEFVSQGVYKPRVTSPTSTGRSTCRTRCASTRPRRGSRSSRVAPRELSPDGDGRGDRVVVEVQDERAGARRAARRRDARRLHAPAAAALGARLERPRRRQGAHAGRPPAAARRRGPRREPLGAGRAVQRRRALRLARARPDPREGGHAVRRPRLGRRPRAVAARGATAAARRPG